MVFSSTKLFCLSLLATFLIATAPSGYAKKTHPLDRFESQVHAYEDRDKATPPANGQTLFIGSSTFALWKTLEDDLKDLHAINRGFGGSTIPESIYYEKRLVAPYKPAKIVFYAGTNDIAEGHSGKQVCADFYKFVDAVQEDVPDAEIYFISMSVAPSRLKMQRQFDIGNDCIESRMVQNKHVHFIDVRPVMRDKDNNLRGEYFGPDNLHMTRAGYEAWMPIIREALK